ncbi:MAG: hypothetical protein GX318_05840 [Clostridia bacterium]|nr:hypothetical protein [Clostridia bacterium]
MIFPLATAVVLIAILVFVGAIFFAAKGEHSEGGDDVIKNVYVYLVLFATLMMVIGGSVAAFMAFTDILAPTPYHQSFEDFKRWAVEDKSPDGEIVEPKPTDEELQDRYDAMVKTDENRQIARAKNTLIKSFSWILIPLPVFIYFQRLIRRRE